MRLKSQFRLSLSLLLATAFIPGPFATANGLMISTNQAVSRIALDADRQKVAEYLSRDDVKNQLVKFGVDPREASQRVASLSDREVQSLAKHIDSSQVGGDTLVGVLSLVLIVLLIIYLAQRI